MTRVPARNHGVLLGFRPTVDLDRGLAEEVAWFARLAESRPEVDAAG